MRHLTAAAACLAAWPLCFALPSRADDPAPPTSRPVNEVPTIRFGGNTWANQPGTAMTSYGTDVPVMGAPLPPGRVASVPIEDYFKQLQAHIPRLRYVVVRRWTGVTSDGPSLPAMDTTDLTLGEFVNFVNANCPGARIEPDTSVSEVDPLYVVTLSPPAVASTRTATPHVVRAVSVRAAVQVQQRVRAEDATSALADVLSLVQVIVDDSPDGRGAKLKVHEPTGMLIFDGPAPLADAVAGAVTTMGQLTADQQHLLEVEAKRVQRLELELKNEQLRAANSDDRLGKLSDENRRLQSLQYQMKDSAELEIADLRRQLAQAATRPAGK